MQPRRILSQVSRVCLFAFAVSLILFTIQQPFSAHAQNPSGWEVIETCTSGLTYPILPRSQWAFEGVIFSENREGVRAIRTDVDSSYFIALEGGTAFPSVGAFSPDGNWFAYPVGSTEFGANSVGANAYGIDAIEVVSTDPERAVIRLSWWDHGMGMEPKSALTPIEWVDNERILAAGFRRVDGEVQEGLLNVFSDTVEPWSFPRSLYGLSGLAPDMTRGFAYDRQTTPPEQLVDIENDHVVASLNPWNIYGGLAWFSDSSGFLIITHSDNLASRLQLAWYNRDGSLIDILWSDDGLGTLAVAHQETLAAFTSNRRLYLADLPNRQIHDLCFEFESVNPLMRLVWSPDGQQLGFTYDGYPVLLFLDTLAMQILDYPTETLVGWFALDEEG